MRTREGTSAIGEGLLASGRGRGCAGRFGRRRNRCWSAERVVLADRLEGGPCKRTREGASARIPALVVMGNGNRKTEA